ncbi:hypothetical protein BGY98DRAFT_1042335, partial [Russula aff. rugulosa BPL654]
MATPGMTLPNVAPIVEKENAFRQRTICEGDLRGPGVTTSLFLSSGTLVTLEC